MDNEKDNKYYLKKIINDISFILNSTKELSFEEFDENELVNSAVNFKFIQIAENANKIEKEFMAENDQIPWYKMKGMRNKIVHEYNNVFLDVVYKTIKDDLDPLLKELKELLSTL